MATFKVGQRVRCISYADTQVSGPYGRDGTIDRFTGRFVQVLWDGISSPVSPTWAMHPHELAPLTPPAEDTWAADAVRKVTKPQPVEVPVMRHLTTP